MTERPDARAITLTGINSPHARPPTLGIDDAAYRQSQP